MSKLFNSFLLVIVSLLSFLFYGFVISTLWDWFILNQFASVKLTVVGGLGLSMFVRMLTMKDFTNEQVHTVSNGGSPDKLTTKELWIKVALQYSVGFIALFVGWLLHLCM